MTLYSPRYMVNITLNFFVFKNKMAVSRFGQVSAEEISKMSFSMFFNSEIILKQLFASGSVNIVE